MKESQFHELVIRRLDVLISLRLDTPETEATASVSSKVKRLCNLGLSAGEISKILGKPVNYVTAMLSQQKAARAKGK